jgi:hypothetical protein
MEIMMKALFAFAAVLATGFTTPVAAQDKILFPGRGADLGSGHYWVVDEFSEGANILDLNVMRWDAQLNRWTSRKNGISQEAYDQDPTNDKHLCYGLPLYAPVDGEIISAWRNAPDNPAPGEKLPGIGTTISASGNHVAIATPDGKVILLAHLKPGTVPTALCPFNDTYLVDASDRDGDFPAETVIPAAMRPQVRKGDYIGDAGNSGNSSGPHLHTQLKPLNGTATGDPEPIPFYGAWAQDQVNAEASPTAWYKLDPQAITSASGDSLILPSPFLRRGDETAGPVSEVAIAGEACSGYVSPCVRRSLAIEQVSGVGTITAVRDASGNLKLITWGVSSSGEIERKLEASAGAVTDIAMAHPGFTRDVVTALRDANGNLKLISWDVLSPSGGIVRKGAATAGAVERIAMTRSPRGIGVVTAVRSSNDELKLIAWEVTPSKNFIRRGDAAAGMSSEIAITRIDQGRSAADDETGAPGQFVGVVTAVRDGDGNLKLIAWEVTPAMELIRRGEASAGAVHGAVAIASARVSTSRESLLTAVRTEDGNLKMIAWEINAQGELERKGEASAGAIGRVDLVRMVDNDVVTAVRDGDGDLKLISWEVSPTGQVQRQGDTGAGSISQVALSGRIIKGGKEFVVGALRDGDGNLKTIAWELNLKP